MKHFEDLHLKYNNLLANSSSNLKNTQATNDEVTRLGERLKMTESTLEEVKKSRSQLHSGMDSLRVEKERTSVELDTARQKIIMLEKEIRLKSAMIEQYEQRFNSDPDELLTRIEQLKNELEQFNMNKDEVKDSEAKKVLERVNHGLDTLWVTLTCKGCLERVSRGFVGVNCGHLVCINCMEKSECVDCGKLTEKLEIPLLEQIFHKLSYFKQGLEDLSLNLR
jgi:predicted  nucleic acid-binding Zn-ribbon protein